jgi:hypothetical protein
MTKEKYEESIEYTSKVAECLFPILGFIDAINTRFEIADLKKVLGKINSQASILQALPFDATMNKGDTIFAQGETFKKIIELAEIRQEQIETQKEIVNRKEAGQEVLRQMGFIS